jgi:hypothetical protein
MSRKGTKARSMKIWRGQTTSTPTVTIVEGIRRTGFMRHTIAPYAQRGRVALRQLTSKELEADELTNRREAAIAALQRFSWQLDLVRDFDDDPKTLLDSMLNYERSAPHLQSELEVVRAVEQIALELAAMMEAISEKYIQAGCDH